MDAMEYPDETNHPCHPKHPLRLLKNESIANLVCRSCGELIEEKKKCYGCSICGDLNLHLDCATNTLSSPTLVVHRPKTHEHPLTLLPREITFTCNACGAKGEASPLMCFPCCFMIHKDGCFDLPRVIRINRHLHRLSYTLSLASKKKLDCGICRKIIDGRYGAYYSQVDPEFLVHSRCATRADVWDGIDLEGIPEEETLSPFIVIDDNKIIHFSHEKHQLNLSVDDGIAKAKSTSCCYACNLCVFHDPFYQCVECDFILHKECANLPPEIRRPIHEHTLTLLFNDLPTDGNTNFFKCAACEQHSNGFRYFCSRCKIAFDTRCSSITDPFDSADHLPPLRLSSHGISTTCLGCHRKGHTRLSCQICHQKGLTSGSSTTDPVDFQDHFHSRRLSSQKTEKKQKKVGLCCACATIPNLIHYEYDLHPLSLNHGEERDETGATYWCDSCEKKVNPEKYFYECSKCETVVHSECALGGFRNLKTGLSFDLGRYKCVVVPNDQASRLHCSKCERCNGYPMLKCEADDHTPVTYFCSFDCFQVLSFSQLT